MPQPAGRRALSVNTCEPLGGRRALKPTGMTGPSRGNLKTGGIILSGRVIQRDPRVPNVLSQYVDPGPAVIPRDPRKERGESRIPHHSTTSSRTHLRLCRALSHPLTTAAAALSLGWSGTTSARVAMAAAAATPACLPATGRIRVVAQQQRQPRPSASPRHRRRQQRRRRPSGQPLAAVGQAQRRAAVGQHSAAASAAAS